MTTDAELTGLLSGVASGNGKYSTLRVRGRRLPAKGLNDASSRNSSVHQIFEKFHLRGVCEREKPLVLRDPQARRLRLSETLVCERIAALSRCCPIT